MARAAVLARLTWRRARLEAVHPETATARTLALTVPGWTGHTPGQHVDVRVTAPDGYAAIRAYSIGSAPATGTLSLTVEATEHGEVSPYLADIAQPGVELEVRGPLGRWFVWSPATEGAEPVQLIGGGSGVVPLMSMLRTHRTVASPTPMRLLCSVRSPAALLYAAELEEHGGAVTVVYTRDAPAGHPRPPRRVDAADLSRHVLPAEVRPQCYVCGPTPFVEAVIQILLEQGHPSDRIRAERFGSGRS